MRGCWRWLRWGLGCSVLVACGCGAFSMGLMIDAIRLRRLPVESESFTLINNGIERVYRVYAPDDLDPAELVPLVFVLHGGGGDARGAEQITQSGFNRLADRDHFIVVYPEGLDKHWIDGRAANANETRGPDDDVAFFAALIDQIAADYPIDRRRVYATGISNGGIMSYRLACDLSDQIAAIAAVTANLWEGYEATCTPLRPIPVLILNGTDDPLIKWDGGPIRMLGRDTNRGNFRSTDDTVAYWLANNHCTGEPEITELPDLDPDDHTRVTHTRYTSCDAGSVVELYTITGGGHTWPGGAQYLHRWLVGRTTRDLDGNAAIWDFFQAHEMPD